MRPLESQEKIKQLFERQQKLVKVGNPTRFYKIEKKRSQFVYLVSRKKDQKHFLMKNVAKSDCTGENE